MNIPIFPKTPMNKQVKLTVSDKTNSGTIASIPVIISGQNGTKVNYIFIKPTGSNQATKVRVFLNNGRDLSLDTNNVLYEEATIPAATVSSTVASSNFKIPMNIKLPPNWRVLVSTYEDVPNGLDVISSYIDY